MRNLKNILEMTDEKEKKRIINKLLQSKDRKKWKEYDKYRWSEKYKAIDRKGRLEVKRYNREILRKINLQPYEIAKFPTGNWNEGKKHCSTMSEWQRKMEEKENYNEILRKEIKNIHKPLLERRKEEGMYIEKEEPAIIIYDDIADLMMLKIKRFTNEKEPYYFKIKKNNRVMEVKCEKVEEDVHKIYRINNIDMEYKDLLEIAISTGIKIYEVVEITDEKYRDIEI